LESKESLISPKEKKSNLLAMTSLTVDLESIKSKPETLNLQKSVILPKVKAADLKVQTNYNDKKIEILTTSDNAEGCK
jgi:hypothetical protein